MKKEIIEVKKSIYKGMDIYKVLKNSILKVDNKIISLDEKKYLSLYLGLISTDNSISNKINLNGIKFNEEIIYPQLEFDEYIEIYNEYFIDVFCNINFESISEYFKYLLTKDIIKKVNKHYNINVDVFISNMNKQLIKK